MKTLIALILLTSAASAQYQGNHQVQGHYRNNGTYVDSYQRTNPDSNPHNNYSTQGNQNPYTGQNGTRNPYR
jgi:hypothetical protein